MEHGISVRPGVAAEIVSGVNVPAMLAVPLTIVSLAADEDTWTR